MNFVDTMRKALAGEITVRTWWGCSGLTGDGFRQWFRQRLDARINRQDLEGRSEHGRRLR